MLVDRGDGVLAEAGSREETLDVEVDVEQVRAVQRDSRCCDRRRSRASPPGNASGHLGAAFTKAG